MATLISREQPRKPIYRRLWIIGMIVLALAAGAGYYWFVQSKKENAVTAEATTVTVELESYSVTVAGPGTLAPSESFSVTTDIAGTVASIALAGERVSEGDILAQLDPAPFERALFDAELALQKAEGQVESLAANQSNSSSSLTASIANAELSVVSAQRALDEAQQQLTLTEQLYT